MARRFVRTRCLKVLRCSRCSGARVLKAPSTSTDAPRREAPEHLTTQAPQHPSTRAPEHPSTRAPDLASEPIGDESAAGNRRVIVVRVFGRSPGQLDLVSADSL